MSNNLTVFQNEQFGQIRTIDENGKIYFYGKDAAIALGYADSVNALKRHCRAKGVVFRHLLTEGGNQRIKFIDEGNLYRLITHSKLPEAERFETWVFDEVLPTIRKTGKFEAHKATDDLKAQRVATAKKNADIRSAKLLLQIADSTKTQYKEVLQAHATKLITGEFLLPLPEVKERTYSAGEIAELLGVSANKIGRLSNENGMKTEYYGKWFYDKSRHSDKQVETFRYYEKAIEVFRKLLEVAA